MKRNLFKIFFIFIAEIMVVSMVIGCGTADDQVLIIEDSKPVILRLSADDDTKTKEQVGELINAFSKKYPDIRIEIEPKFQDIELLKTAVLAGDAPDIFWANGNKDNQFIQIVKIGGAMDITGKINTSIFDSKALECLKLNNSPGKLYITPGAAIDTRVVYYNKDLFDRYKLKEPNTLKEFEKICDTFLLNGVTPIAVSAKSNILWCLDSVISAVAPDWLEEAGKAKLDDPRLMKAFKKLEEWKQKGYFGKNYLLPEEDEVKFNFLQANTAMCIDASWKVRDLMKGNPELKLGAFQMPMTSGGRAMIVTYSTGFAGYSRTKYPNEVIKFLQYASSLEALQIMTSMDGIIPSVKGIKVEDDLTRAMGTADIQVTSFYSILEKWNKHDKDIGGALNADLNLFLSGDLNAQDLIKRLDATIY